VDPESKQLLQETMELAQENNKMLHSMKRSMRMSQIMSFLYWVLIIGSAIGAFYFLQPYLTQVEGLYNNASGVLKNFNNSK
jgi:TRAP-type C4-dicarboxylate transport system permease small subunit